MENSIFYAGYGTGYDKNGYIRQVTAVGVRKEIKNTLNYGQPICSNVSGTDKCIINVSFAIFYPGDTLDPKMGASIAKRRIKQKQFITLSLKSDKVIPAPICQAIVEAEAQRIANNIDLYIDMLQNR